MIKHHNFYKVHLPKKDYRGEDDNELMEILMEEFQLFSDGKWTKNYESINPKEDYFEISLYPSIVYKANKLDFSKQQKFQLVNDFLDDSFVDFLERFHPLHKCTRFLEYHLYYFSGDEMEFYKHIKYQILAIIEKRKRENKYDFDYDSLLKILNDWLIERMEIINHNINMINGNNIIINKKSKIKSQSIGTAAKQKESIWNKINVLIALVVGIVTIIGIIWGILF